MHATEAADNDGAVGSAGGAAEQHGQILLLQHDLETLFHQSAVVHRALLPGSKTDVVNDCACGCSDCAAVTADGEAQTVAFQRARYDFRQGVLAEVEDVLEGEPEEERDC